MDVLTLDPIKSSGLPNVIEDVIDASRRMCCLKFNRTGTLLAAGCLDGNVLIYDFDTRGLAREWKLHESVVVNLSWSSCGTKLLSSSRDNDLILWDVIKGETIKKIVLNEVPLGTVLHPDRNCVLINSWNEYPKLLDMDTGDSKPIPMDLPEQQGTQDASSQEKYYPVIAEFISDGRMIAVGDANGQVSLLNSENFETLCGIKVGGSAKVSEFCTNRDGTLLAVTCRNSKKNAAQSTSKTHVKIYQIIRPDLTSFPTGLELSCEFHTPALDEVFLKRTCFSFDGEFFVGPASSETKNVIYIWSLCTMTLVNVLQGPPEVLWDAAWCPRKALLLQLSDVGKVYVWAKMYAENWSSFAPGFRELQANEEYIEKEDEFDIVESDSNLANSRNEDYNDEYVDIIGGYKKQRQDAHLPVEIDIEVKPKEEEPIDNNTELNGTDAMDTKEAEANDLGENAPNANNENGPNGFDPAKGRMRVKNKKYADEVTPMAK